MLICRECGLQYDVVWSYDGDESPDEYCPRCGSDYLESDEEGCNVPYRRNPNQ